MPTTYERLNALYNALHHVNPKVAKAIATPNETIREDYFKLDRMLPNLTRLTLSSGFSAAGWLLGEMIAHKAGLTLEEDYAAISVITGASSALFGTLSTAIINGIEYRNATTEQQKSLADFIEQNWRDILSLFIVVTITDSMWMLFYDELAILLAQLFQGSSDITLGNLVASMIFVFGGLTTLVTYTLSILIGFALCDSGSAGLQNALSSGVAGGVMFGTIGELAALIEGLRDPAYIGLTFATVALGSAAVGAGTTGVYYGYHRMVKTHDRVASASINNDPEAAATEVTPLVEHDATREDSLSAELLYRTGLDSGKKPRLR